MRPRRGEPGEWRTGVTDSGRVGWTDGNGPLEINHAHHPDELRRGDPDPRTRGRLSWLYSCDPPGGTLCMCRHIGMSTRTTPVRPVTSAAGGVGCTTRSWTEPPAWRWRPSPVPSACSTWDAGRATSCDRTSSTRSG